MSERLDARVRRRLVALRAERGFTQHHVAAAVGWTQATVSKYELGDQGVDLDTLVQLAAFYGLPICALIDGIDAPIHDPETARLLAAWGRLSAEQRAALLVMLDAAAPVKARPSGPARRSARRARTPTQ